MDMRQNSRACRAFSHLVRLCIVSNARAPFVVPAFVKESTTNGALIFSVIMDSYDEEPSFQLYAIKDEQDSLIDNDDISLLPSFTDVDNKQIFYLSFDEQNETGQELNQHIRIDDEEESESAIFQMENIQENNSVDFNETDVKLITLGDGRMFVTTDKNLESLQGESQLIISKTDDTSQSVDFTQYLDDNPAKDDDVTNDVSDLQLIKLVDGSYAVVKMYKNDEEEEEEEVAPKVELPAKKPKKFHCCYEGCDKVYASSYHLTVHMRSHTDFKPFECNMDGCNKKFSTNYSLKAHIRTHTGEKPYGCSLCAKHFKTSGDLQKHIRIHTGEKPFVCPYEGCGRSFTTSNIRKVHIRSHTGERPYSCTYPDCGKAFTSSTNYKNHLRIHSGEKPYVCSWVGCEKRFTEYSSLYKHNTVHQPQRRYSCKFCGQNYKLESALNLHKRLKHDILVTKDGTEIMVKIH